MPYPPAEDSILLLQNLRCGKKVLDMGTGTGIIAIECAKRGSEVVAVDIDKFALDYAMKKASMENVKIKFLKSDLFENVDGRFETIIFNPPYLPGEPRDTEDLQWAGGGEYGDEIIMRFLDEAWKYLEQNGEIYIVLSSFNRVKDMMKKYPYFFKKVAEMKLAFHSIYVYRLRHKV